MVSSESLNKESLNSQQSLPASWRAGLQAVTRFYEFSHVFCWAQASSAPEEGPHPFSIDQMLSIFSYKSREKVSSPFDPQSLNFWHEVLCLPWIFRRFPSRLPTSIISSSLSRNSLSTWTWENRKYCLKTFAVHKLDSICKLSAEKITQDRKTHRSIYRYFRVCRSLPSGSSLFFHMRNVALTIPIHRHCSHKSH